MYPLDLVVTRLQVQRKQPKLISEANEELEYDGISDALRKIYFTEGGFPALYTGVAQDTLKSVADSFLFFLFYNSLLSLRRNRSSKSNSSLFVRLMDEVGTGMVAGATARAITMPIQQVITRKQTMAMKTSQSSESMDGDAPPTERSVSDILRRIYDTKGLSGFWAGYSATVVLTLNPSLTMSVDSMLQRLTARRMALGPTLTFLLAAISKATASSIMYPATVAKTRAQTSASDPSEGRGNTRKARSGSTLNMIARTARSDGIGALYAGLSAEVVKGFFSHGLTMMAKYRIHAFVIQAYFLIVKYLRRLKKDCRD